MLVKFATLCDKCNKRSEEYSPWFVCKECMGDFCDSDNCSSERTNDEGKMRCLCNDCKKGQELFESERVKLNLFIDWG